MGGKIKLYFIWYYIVFKLGGKIMKSKLFKLLVLCLVACAVLFAVSCTITGTTSSASEEESAVVSESYSEEETESESEIEEVGDSYIQFTTLTANGTSVYGKVANARVDFSFANEIEVVGDADFIVSLDSYGTQTVITKTVPLSIGDNTFYVFETINNKLSKTYVVTIRRRPIYTVSFNVKGGSYVSSQYVEEDSFATEPTTSKGGYDFVSWDYDFASPITNSITINASWSINVYDITYELNGGENHEGNPARYTAETSTIILQTPTKTGYTFNGWFAEETFENQVTAIPLGSYGDKAYYAKWALTEYTITYNYRDIIVPSNPYDVTNNSIYPWALIDGVLTSGNNGINNSTSVYKITANSKVTVSFEYKVSSESNYDKLIIALNGIEKVNKSGTMSYESYTITLDAGDVLTFTYSKDGSQHSNDDNAYIKNLTYAPDCVEKVLTDTYTIVTPTFDLIEPTREGYTFNGWFTEDSFENIVTEIPLGSYGDKAFYAKWIANEDTRYTVEYYLQNIDESGYVLECTEELVGMTDAIVYVEVEELEHFIYNEIKSVITGNVYGDGSLILRVYYDVDHIFDNGKCTYCGEKVYKKVGEYIYFGEYPQSLKDEDVEITGERNSKGYYKGSDGEWYAKIVAYSWVPGYTFANGSPVINDKTYYFKVEPIKWRILEIDGENAFLVCENVIEDRGFTGNDYANSDVRKWLNSDFLNTAFSSSEQEIILTTKVDNSAASTAQEDNKFACEETNDNIFLLSYKEVSDSKYFSSDEARIRKASDYSKAQGVDSSWWLRSPYMSDYGYGDYMCSCVFKNGSIGKDSAANVSSSTVGLVPALKIQL